MIYIRRIVGDSMLPYYKQGKIVIAIKSKHYKPGQVVVVNHKNQEVIKRIKSINKNKVYSIGDNLSKSTDSRHFGSISREFIVGKVLINF